MISTLTAALTALFFTLGDWMQTRYIATHPEEYYEINRILGKHPTPRQVNVYFLLCILIVGVIGFLLPAPWGLWIFTTTAFLEAFMVARNTYLGIKFK